MGFLLDEKSTGRHWRTYFDYILVDAQKPLFFAEGTSLKEINIVSRHRPLIQPMVTELKFQAHRFLVEHGHQAIWQPFWTLETEPGLLGRQL